jgi:hypothetical protein
MQSTAAKQAPAPNVAFASAHAPGADAVAATARYTSRNSVALVAAPYPGDRGAMRLRTAARGSFLILDSGAWRRREATVAEPMELSTGLTLLDSDTWTSSVASSTGAAAVLSPSFHIAHGHWDALAALLQAVRRTTDPRAVALIPLDASVLETAGIGTLLSHLDRVADMRMAFVFTGQGRPLAVKQRLVGLRRLLSEHRGTWVLGLDPLVSADALAHGAGLVAVGTGSSTRHPDGPGQSTRGFAQRWLPGMFYRPLLEHRSPAKYADWFANKPVGACAGCGLDPDRLEPVDSDRLAVIAHNLHATHAWLTEVHEHAADQRVAYLAGERAEALARHVSLKPLAMAVDADLTLRWLCELDDPQGRLTTPQGAWL